MTPPKFRKDAPMKTTLTFPGQLHAHIRSQAALAGVSMSELVVQALLLGLREMEGGARTASPPKEEAEQVAISEGTKEYRLERTGQPPLRFVGERVAHGATQPDRALADWSGQTGRWQQASVYRTEGGKYILAIAHLTAWDGEMPRHEATVHSDIPDLAEALRGEEHHLHPAILDDLFAELDVTEDVE